MLIIVFCVYVFWECYQDLYIGDGGEFYLKASTYFTTSNSVINHHVNGVFSVEAGNAWSAATEYVNGKITVIGAGTTTVKLYKDVSIQVGINSIDKPNVAEGLYLLQFSFNNGEQQIIKRVVIE